jgi:outer membrane protein OmpA-like peptidoglycan-associated protein
LTRWRGSKVPEEYAHQPEVHRDSEREPAQRLDPLLALQRSMGNRAVQKLLPPTPGEPIAESERPALEAAFGEDLSEVRIHRSEQAGKWADAAGANAFSSGRDIYFAPGAYNSSTLAHEVTHVVQQDGATSVTPGEDPLLEHQAEIASASVLSGGHAEIAAVAAAPAMQRQPAPGKTSPLKLPRYSLTLDDFDIDKAKLHANHKQMLDEFAEGLVDILSLSPGAHVLIGGFADTPGTESHNLEIGQERADAVRDYLVQKGAPEYALRTHSSGAGSPAVASKGFQAKNRRVEIVVSERTFMPSGAGTSRGKPASPQIPSPKDAAQQYVPHPMETPEETKARHDTKEDKAVKDAKRKNEESRSSVSDRAGKRAREIAKEMGLPKWLQDRAESLGKQLPAKGAQALLDQIAAAQGLGQDGQSALNSIIDKLAQEKF